MVNASYLDAIKQFEGYTAEARWDYAQNSNGYGTRARFAGEVIDKAEAERRFATEVQKAADFVDKFAPGLDDGSKAALTSLTYNAGTSWAQSGLGEAITSGDLDKAKSLFLQYNKAGGATLDGLVQRRLQEVAWFGQGFPATQAASAGFAAMASAASGAATSQTSSTAPVALPNTSTPTARSILASYERSASADATTQSLSSFASDQALLSLLAKMAAPGTAESQDDKQKADRRPDRNSIVPDIGIRTV